MAEIREHIDTALLVDREGDISAEVAVRTVIERLGPPEEIVRAEIEDTPYGATWSPDPVASPTPTGHWGGLEITAIASLAAGSILVPIIGPLMPIGGLFAASYLVLTLPRNAGRSQDRR